MYFNLSTLRVFLRASAPRGYVYVMLMEKTIIIIFSVESHSLLQAAQREGEDECLADNTPKPPRAPW